MSAVLLTAQAQQMKPVQNWFDKFCFCRDSGSKLHAHAQQKNDTISAEPITFSFEMAFVCEIDRNGQNSFKIQFIM